MKPLITKMFHWLLEECASILEKVLYFLLDNQKIKYFINHFVTNIVLQHIVLSWIVQSNKNTIFVFQKHCTSWIINGPWYNTKIFSRLYDSVFENYFTTAKHNKYNLMYSIEVHEKNRKSVNKQKPVDDETSSGGGIPLPPNPTEKSLKPFGLALNLIESWLK